MPRGGKRPGAGKPKGTKQAPSAAMRDKLECRRIYHERVSQQLEPIIEAQLAAARGVCHMMAQDAKGQWTRVTDPEAMLRCLNSGQTLYRVYAQNPDQRAIIDILDRELGKPKETIDLQASVNVATLSDAELKARMLALLQKLG
jgi:hypothetical protein